MWTEKAAQNDREISVCNPPLWLFRGAAFCWQQQENGNPPPCMPFILSDWLPVKGHYIAIRIFSQK